MLQVINETPANIQQPVTYGYDAIGRMLSRTAGDNTDTWKYDTLGRVSQLSNALGSFDYAYLGNSNQVRSETLQHSKWRTDFVYASNRLDRQLLAITHPPKLIGAKSIFTLHDEEGRLLARHDWPLGQHDHYAYDDADRLTSVVQGMWLGGRGHDDHSFWRIPPFGKTTFDYDDADNILSITKGRKQTTFTANDANQVVTENNQSYSYDANGNLLDDGRFTYTWDAENRLLSATNKTSGEVSAFAYDGLSRRISNTETVKDSAGNSQSTTTYYQWCGDTLCMALDSSGTVTERYYPQGEQINGDNRYYATDKLGNVMQVVNAKGKLLGEARYDAYGKRELARGIQPRFGYAGMFRHESTGLDLTLYRAYNPQTGRWLSRDPIGENGGQNVYAYVGGNPINAIDPLGLWAWGDPLPQGAVDAAAGFGDGVSFGGTDWLRDQMGTNGSVAKCSSTYSGSKYAGYAWGIATTWSAGLNGGANSVFWSGTGNMGRAAKLGTSLESTPIGALMNRFGEYVPYSMWKVASGTFAANARGEAIKVGTQLGRIWSTVEAPILNARGIPVRIVP